MSLESSRDSILADAARDADFYRGWCWKKILGTYTAMFLGKVGTRRAINSHPSLLQQTQTLI